MLRTQQAPSLHVFSNPLDSLRSHQRSIEVVVLSSGRETDRFCASNLGSLRSCLLPIFNYGTKEVTLLFSGVEEDWLPLRLGYQKHDVELNDLDDAFRFLAA